MSTTNSTARKNLKRFRVSGAEHLTGRKLSRIVEAKDQLDAEAAAMLTMRVSKVELESECAAPAKAAACENCGGMIGKLEAPRQWEGHAVCAVCYQRLAESAPIPVEPLSYATPAKQATTDPRANGPFIICPNLHCGYRGPSIREPKGEWAAALLLLALGGIPGILYMIFYSGFKIVCPNCKIKLRSEGQLYDSSGQV